MTLTRIAAMASLAAVTAFTLAACGGGDDNSTPPAVTAPPPPALKTQFKATTLVSDGSATAANIDPNLKNGWGIAFNPTGVMWVSDNNTHLSTLYDGNGVPQSLVVSIPANAAGTAAGPTGIVFNKTAADFQISANGGAAANAVFMWATDAGTIAAWSPKVLPTQAVNAYDDGAGGAVYKGLAIGVNAGANVIYATDFHNKKVDTFDRAFNKILVGKFVDPNLPAGFSPFGIAAIGNNVYVSYAVLGSNGRTQVNGAGNGVVDAFDTAGNFVKRVATGGTLNSPWGMVVAPSNFGSASNDLLVGNFGDGTIDVFDPTSNALIGALPNPDGSTFKQAGIWGMSFGNNAANQPANTLFYAAGPTPTTGVYGRIDVTP
ncbi:TIGR03118 family protein [Burkholderia sp. Ac-20379]|uniref:TIGR03118 family protein n=1 Tax=Burkholderia sp. Ac-20379 TaxID=2703900 RepID=UPI00197CF27E|nr:TIGR03118 family protein [Burkholderia sp. Ac-20379]MBN3722992.1 TIGR03118 family protein [Burkholderia sp. Ac-20379]